MKLLNNFHEKPCEQVVSTKDTEINKDVLINILLFE